MAYQFQYYQYVFQNWISQFPQFIQLFIWMMIVGLIIKIGFEIAKWTIVGGLTATVMAIAGIVVGIKKIVK